jgi:hypothetical protein
MTRIKSAFYLRSSVADVMASCLCLYRRLVKQAAALAWWTGACWACPCASVDCCVSCWLQVVPRRRGYALAPVPGWSHRLTRCTFSLGRCTAHVLDPRASRCAWPRLSGRAPVGVVEPGPAPAARLRCTPRPWTLVADFEFLSLRAIGAVFTRIAFAKSGRKGGAAGAELVTTDVSLSFPRYPRGDSRFFHRPPCRMVTTAIRKTASDPQRISNTGFYLSRSNVYESAFPRRSPIGV